LNYRLLNALEGKNYSGRPPIWLMRQAGRYLPSYMALRQRYSFLDLCHTPELAAEVTLLPLKLFPFDAAILFSDILVVAESFGRGLRFEEEKGPIIERPIKTAQDIEKLPEPNAEESLSFVAEAIKLLLPELSVPLLGFAGAPFTIASYLIEGQSSSSLSKTKEWLVKDPDSFHNLLGKISNLTIDYLKMQAKAGVCAVQIFDSWAHQLAPRHFCEFSLPYIKKIVEGLRDLALPTIVFSRASSLHAEKIAAISPTAISIDWSGNIAEIRKKLPNITLQGNLDPFILYGSKESIEQEVGSLLSAMKDDPRYIFNLGHGILPTTPLDAVHQLCTLVHG
jgi:uroporphyrinogen decarboxylase